MPDHPFVCSAENEGMDMTGVYRTHDGNNQQTVERKGRTGRLRCRQIRHGDGRHVLMSVHSVHVIC